MGSIKVFYRRETPIKNFFARETEVRSFAYGKTVSKEFSEWREYFIKSLSVYKDKFRPFSQRHFYGELAKDAAGKAPDNVRGVNGEKYDLLADGVMSVGGKRSALQVGSETKAWSLVCFPRREGQVTAVAVVGKPKGSSQMQLCVYRSVGGRLESEPYCQAPLDPTLDAESYLVAFGRHLFLVHNFTLDYYYLDYEGCELQRVAIGMDGENKDKAWCDTVAPRVVANDDGWVFWYTQGSAYGFPIGYPNHLESFSCPITERILNIQGEGKSVILSRQDKNTSKITRYRYERRESGEFSVQALHK